MKQAFDLLNKHRYLLTRQQIRTFKGQILKGNIKGFKKGLNKVLDRVA